MSWPAHLPQDCPPPEAQDALGEVFRLVDHSSPHPHDFRSWREMNMGKELPQGVTECQACGLSVYRDQEDANRVIRRVPRFRQAKVAYGLLRPDFGKLLSTPSKTSKSHHTWWVLADAEPWNVFQIVTKS